MRAQWETDNTKKTIIQVKNNKDIIRLIPQKKITYENGKRIEETIYKQRNITQEINETARLLKLNTLNSKIEELKGALQND